MRVDSAEHKSILSSIAQEVLQVDEWDIKGPPMRHGPNNYSLYHDDSVLHIQFHLFAKTAEIWMTLDNGRRKGRPGCVHVNTTDYLSDPQAIPKLRKTYEEAKQSTTKNS